MTFAIAPTELRTGRLPWDDDDQRTLEDFAALLKRPAWMADALGQECPEVEFHPRKMATCGRRWRSCRRCLIKQECLGWVEQFELSDAETQGVWGALGARERKQRGKAKAAAA